MRDDGMKPRLLLVEDDPVSLAFLSEAARALPAEVDCAASLAEALALASAHTYAAWLIDANLPDGSGSALLAILRERTAPPWPYALAHTADRQPEALAALRGAGFDAAVAKPLPVAEWQAAIRRGLGTEAGASIWDDAQALRALHGNTDSMTMLRALFRTELPKQQASITAALATGDVTAAREELHRLKASCGFVGAAQLRQAVDALHAAPGSTEARTAFDATVAATLQAEASTR